MTTRLCTACRSRPNSPAATWLHRAGSGWLLPSWLAWLACWPSGNAAWNPRRRCSMPPEFNPSYQSPDWAWWIVLYFFVGGVTGGVYFTAAWLDLFGDETDRWGMRVGYLLAFPFILVCALLLIIDLRQPLRFWHMIFESERFPLPILKPYSPMSLGSAILAIFGLIAFLSFLDALFAKGGWWHAPGNPLGKLISLLGGLAGLALAGYTGLLLNTTNLPVWANSPWISALF